jgi:hypothetical protein
LFVYEQQANNFVDMDPESDGWANDFVLTDAGMRLLTGTP